jgi:hypothetical protein
MGANHHGEPLGRGRAQRLVVQGLLENLRPTAQWRVVGEAAGVEVWRRRRPDWLLEDPPEERALPPMLPWTEELREAVIDEYRKLFAHFLDEGEDYDVSWPPDGNLYSEGDWYENDEGENVQSAVWEWHVEVYLLSRPFEDEGRVIQDSSLEDGRYTIGTLKVDPREVEYGPHVNDFTRQVLYLKRAELGL